MLGDAYRGLLQGAVAKAKTLSALRNAFKEYSIGISPRSYVVGFYGVFRDIDLYNLYPIIYGGGNVPVRIFNKVRYYQGFPIVDEETTTLPSIVTIEEEAVLISPRPSMSIPDMHNAPGFWQTRLISVGVQNFHVDADFLISGTKLPRLEIEPSGGEGTQAILTNTENKRWELQNTSATATLTILGNEWLVPRQLAVIPSYILGYPTWHITGVKHTLSPSPDTNFQTELSLSLFQGYYSKASQPGLLTEKTIDLLNNLNDGLPPLTPRPRP